jgi:hypothetical protein
MFSRKFHKLSDAEQKSVFKRMAVAGTNHDGQSHQEFSEKNETFRLHCENAGVECTSRQAAKYRQKTGSAFKNGRN